MVLNTKFIVSGFCGGAYHNLTPDMELAKNCLHIRFGRKGIDRDRTRTCNPQIRSLVPYPLGHTVLECWMKLIELSDLYDSGVSMHLAIFRMFGSMDIQ